jgi:hypothetical protein
MSLYLPITSPIPELSIKETLEKSRISRDISLMRTAWSISARIPAALWWSKSPSINAVSVSDWAESVTAIFNPSVFYSLS